MSRVITNIQPLPPPPPEPTNLVDEDETLILQQVELTRRKIATVEIAWRSLVLVAGLIAYAIVAAIIDQWVCPHGMPSSMRWLLWIIFIMASLSWAIFSLGPYLVKRIHPVFAAYLVEQAVPSLKHSLISFLLLRREKERLWHDPLKLNVFRGLEKNTALQVSRVSPEGVIDRSAILRTGYALLALVALFALMVLLSPKNPFVSAARAVLPWKPIAPPSRVRIDAVQPGSAEVLQGERVVVSAFIEGLRAGEAARVIYSTADGQAVNQAIPLEPVEGKPSRFECELSPAIQQNTTYRLVAGDAMTPEYHLSVVVPLQAKVSKVEYKYPAYTKLEPRVVENLGDIQGIEGTQVTVYAEAPEPLRDAQLVIEGDQKGVLRMAVEDKTLRASFYLKLTKVGSALREYSVYSIRAESKTGRLSVNPVKHTIEVIPDMPPVARWETPTETRLVVPVNGALPLRLRAEDPDFGLAQVVLTVESLGRKVTQEFLLDNSKGNAFTGAFTGEYTFVPFKLNLAAGDVAVCRAEVLDNREPTPNLVKLPELQIRVGDPEQGAQPHSGESSQEQRTSGQTPNKPSPDKGQSDRGQGEPQPPSALEPEKGTQDRQPSSEQKPPTNEMKESPSSPVGDSQAGQASAEQTDRQQPSEGEPSPASSRQSDHPAAGESREPAGGEGGQQTAGDQPGRQTQPSQPQSDFSTQTGGEGNSQTSQTESGGAMSRSSLRDTPAADQQPKERPDNSAQDQASRKPTGEEGGKGQMAPRGASEDQGAEAGEQRPGQSGGPRRASAEGSETEGGASAAQPERSSPGASREQSSPTAPAESADARGQPPSQGDQRGQELQGSQTSQNPPSTPGTKVPSSASDTRSEAGAAQQRTNAAEREMRQEGPTPGEPNREPSTGATSEDGKGPPERSTPSGREKPGSTQSPDQRNLDDRQAQEESPPGEKIDGLSNPGDAFDRVLKYLERIGAASQCDGACSNGAANPKNQGSGERPAAGSSQGTSSGAASGDQSSGSRTPMETPAGESSAAENQEQRETARAVGAGQSQAGDQQPAASSQSGGPPSSSPPATLGTPAPQGDRAPSHPQGEPTSAAGVPHPGQEHAPQNREGESGEQAGLGGPGGGQSTPRQGSGSSGSQSPADGQGGSLTQGPGQETGNAGSSGAAGSAGGQSGDTPGAGQNAASSQAGSGQTAQSQKTATGEKTQSGPGPGGGGLPGGYGGGGAWPGADTPVDDPNLEFARRQTDLVLRFLEDQLAQEKPDEELLKELGWTKEEMAEFVRRWQELKKAAEEDTPRGKQAKRQLNEILRSLGLRPSGTEIQRNERVQDRVHGLGAGRDIPPPPQWSEYFREYLKSLGAAQ